MRSRLLLLSFLGLAYGCHSGLADRLEKSEAYATTRETEQEVKFVGAGGVKLSGTLTIPAGSLAGHNPAVLIIAGSGPTDRDGNQPGLQTDTLKQIAHGLALAEIASFRFDKRAVATNAPQWPKDPAQFGPFFSWDNHIADALAAWEAMKNSGFVDKDKCAILGHSEGGTIALAMASKAKPVSLVLIGTPGRPYDALIHDQLSRKLNVSGPAGQKLLARSDQIAAEIKATGKVPKDVPSELKALYNPSVGVFFKQSFSAVPLELVKSFPGAILIMNGELDQQVDPKLDAQALFDANSKDRGSKLVVIPLASHNLKPVTTSAEAGFAGPVVPDAIQTIQDFLVPVIGG